MELPADDALEPRRQQKDRYCPRHEAHLQSQSTHDYDDSGQPVYFDLKL